VAVDCGHASGTCSLLEHYEAACRQIDTLQRELRQRDAIIASMDPRFPGMGLTRQETRMLWSLYTAPRGFRSYDELAAAGYSRNRLCPGAVSTVVHHAARKAGVEIICTPKYGHRLLPDSKERLRQKLVSA
jgi:hypothetical protein